MLDRGTDVEVCPYSGHHAFHYLAHRRGERGQVMGLKGHGDDLKVSVMLSRVRATVEFPVKAVKPVKAVG